MTASEANQRPYRLKFMPEALKEWQALDGSVDEAGPTGDKDGVEVSHRSLL